MTIEYTKAEERYHGAQTLEEKILATEEMIRAAPKHKGAEKLLKTLKRRLAKLREELQEKQMRRTGRSGGPSFEVKKEGAAQVALIGMPSSGKSSLMRKLTSARPEVSDYPFTTREPVPGMMQFEDVQIQMLEVPAVLEGSSIGKGLGAQPLSAARNADAVALVVDASAEPSEQVRILSDELGAVGIRLNQKPPKITVQRKSTGGVEIKGAEMVEGEEAVVRRILQERRIYNAFVVIEEYVTGDDIEEVLDESAVYRPAFVLLTKKDISGMSGDELAALGETLPVIVAGDNVEWLKKSIYGSLDLIRVYTKHPDEPPAKRPIVMPKGTNVLQIARAVHKDFTKNLKFARVWGSTRFPGQQVAKDYVLRDKDVVELHL